MGIVPRSSGALVLLLALAAVETPASVPWKSRSRVQLEVKLLSPPEVGQSFRVSARATFHEAARQVRVELIAPSGVRPIRNAPVTRMQTGAGSAVAIASEFRVETPLSGAPLVLGVAFLEDGVTVADPLRIEKTAFLTANRWEGREGLPGHCWREWLGPVPAGMEAGYVAADYGPPPLASGMAASRAEAAIGEYATALAALRRGETMVPKRSLAELTRSAAPDVAIAAANLSAIAHALAGDSRGAEAAWTRALAMPELPALVAGYIDYNRGLGRWSAGDRAGARARFEAALASHPGFSLVRRLLDARTGCDFGSK